MTEHLVGYHEAVEVTKHDAFSLAEVLIRDPNECFPNKGA